MLHGRADVFDGSANKTLRVHACGYLNWFIAFVVVPLSILFGTCVADDDVLLENVVVVPKPAGPAPIAVDFANPIDGGFDESIFGAPGEDVKTQARKRLNESIRARIEQLDRVCQLSQEQKDKLELAGAWDIRQLFGQIAEARNLQVKSRMEEIQRNGPRKLLMVSAPADYSKLISTLRTARFGDEARFEKVLNSVLTTEQTAKRELYKLRLMTSVTKISVGNVDRLELADRISADVRRLKISPDGLTVGSITSTGLMQIRSAEDLHVISTPFVGKQIIDFEFCPDPRILAVTENGRPAVIVNIATGAEIAMDTSKRQRSLRMSPDGKLLAAVGDGTKVTLCQAKDGACIFDLSAGQAVRSPYAEFSPDGKKLAIGGENCDSGLFNVETGNLIREFKNIRTYGLAFDPSGRKLATAGVDGTVLIWDVESGRVVKSAPSKSKSLYGVEWSPDGTILATSGLDGSVTLWDTIKSPQSNPFKLSIIRELPVLGLVADVRFNREGTRLIFGGGWAIANDDHSIEIWSVP